MYSTRAYTFCTYICKLSTAYAYPCGERGVLRCVEGEEQERGAEDEAGGAHQGVRTGVTPPQLPSDERADENPHDARQAGDDAEVKGHPAEYTEETC